MSSILSSTALAIILFTSCTVFSQDASSAIEQNISSPPAPTEKTAYMPTDPEAFLTFAAGVNGLAAIPQAWHIQASYQTFDSDGDPETTGTFEEFWVSAKKYKRIYVSSSFTQTDYSTEQGLFRSGNQDWPGPVETKVLNYLLLPVPVNLNFEGVSSERMERSFGSVHLQCITLKPKKTSTGTFRLTVKGYSDAELSPHYCFDASTPILRFSSDGFGLNDVTYNNIVSVQGHYLARDIQVMDRGKKLLTVKVNTLETLSKFDLAPSSDAVGPLHGKVTIPFTTLMTTRTKNSFPEYPEEARKGRIQGKINLVVTIGKDGRVSSAQAIDGPEILQAAAIECVRKWEFRPFLVQGEAVEVETKTAVGFTLGGR